MRVMVVDDSSPVRERMVQMIDELDEVSEVLQASDSSGAIRLMEKNAPQLVVMDLRMPGGGGEEILQFLKSQSWNIVTVVLTNFPYLQLRNKCMELGADYFLDKSTEFEQIIDIVAVVYGNISAEEQ
jgi:DNA-binding NarL/FixJ family response regulator